MVSKTSSLRRPLTLSPCHLVTLSPCHPITLSPLSITGEILALALQHHQAGRLRAAEAFYQQILALEPNHAQALHLSGVVAHQLGQHQEAVDLIERAIGLNPHDAAFHGNLGEARRALGQIPEAIACYRRALELRPDYPEAHCNLGNALRAQGDLPGAIACYRRAVAIRPDFLGAISQLAAALRAQGNLAEAIVYYRRITAQWPELADIHLNLGAALMEQGKLDEAIASYRQALHWRPDYAEALSNLGVALREQHQIGEAVACYRRAIALKPDLAEAHSNLSAALSDLGKLSEAVASSRWAIHLKPDFAEAHLTLGNVLKNQGNLPEALPCYCRAIELKSETPDAFENYLYTLQYADAVSLPQLAREHAEYERRFAARFRKDWQPHANAPDPERKLRLGFVSANLAWNPVGMLLIRTFENLDPTALETVCYSDRVVHDDLTARFRKAATLWRDVYGMADEQLAEQIRGDGIDILFDLTGHIARNRLLLFARRPAPVQVTWIGYEGTTGVTAIDYLLADRTLVPPESEPYYTEKILRLRDCYVCFDPPAEAPAVGPLPALANGFVTFGSFNNPAKITPEVVAVWAEILRHCGDARLVLKYRGMDDAQTQDRYRSLFAACGIGAERLDLRGRTSPSDALAQHQGIDVALDPFPFTGSVTTCLALWMGVPVVTCPGETFASRRGLSYLAAAGLTELSAASRQNYVQIAVDLANDLPRLTALRAELRQRVANSPLCDGQRHAAALQESLRDAWRSWVARP